MGALEASLSQDLLEKITVIWLVRSHLRGLHNRQSIFGLFNDLINLCTAQNRLKFGLQLPS